MDCPVCGGERTERSHGDQLAVIECQSCRRLPLWWVGLLAAGGLTKDVSTLAGSVLYTTALGTKRLGSMAATRLHRGLSSRREDVEPADR